MQGQWCDTEAWVRAHTLTHSAVIIFICHIYTYIYVYAYIYTTFIQMFMCICICTFISSWYRLELCKNFTVPGLWIVIVILSARYRKEACPCTVTMSAQVYGLQHESSVQFLKHGSWEHNIYIACKCTLYSHTEEQGTRNLIQSLRKCSPPTSVPPDNTSNKNSAALARTESTAWCRAFARDNSQNSGALVHGPLHSAHKVVLGA